MSRFVQAFPWGTLLGMVAGACAVQAYHYYLSNNASQKSSNTANDDEETDSKNKNAPRSFETQDMEDNVSTASSSAHEERKSHSSAPAKGRDLLRKHPSTFCSDDSDSVQSGRRDLLSHIAHVQRRFFKSEKPQVVFGLLLDALLELTDSEYGFIGEIKYDKDTGAIYLQTHAITNIAWNTATRKFYEDNKDDGLKFFNLNSLFGTVMTTQEPVIANDPANHPNRAGIPEGHPPLNHFMGIPFFQKDGQMNGMVGVSNKPGGYSQADVDFVEPLTVTCSNLIQAYNQRKENQFLIDNLEASVQARTAELEKANAELEQANRKVKQSAQMQLQHFACMSHEIRTPLNCIIGMSSVLKESKMTRMQEETVQMIIESGDLLVAIINDVLDFSKLETGNFDLEIRQCNLQQTLVSIVHSIEMKAASRGQVIRQTFDAAVPCEIHMDSRRVQQILFNLLGNAIKFSPDGGVVKFDVKFLPNDLPLTAAASSRHSITTLEGSLSIQGGILDNILDAEMPVSLANVLLAHRQQADEMGEDEKMTTEGDSSATCAASSAADWSRENSTENINEGGGCPLGSSTHSRNEFGQPEESHHDAPPGGACPFVGSESRNVQKEPESTNECPFHRATSTGSQSIEPSAPGSNSSSSNLAERSPVPVMGKSAGYMIRFVVKDYGRGIPTGDFERIFKPFQQASGRDMEDVVGGTGLGLAITHRLVSAMGGAIKVNSELGKWSEFTVDLPVCDRPAEVAVLSDKLSNCTMVAVGVSKDDEHLLTGICDSYKVDLRIYESMDIMQKSLLRETPIDRSYACLIQEDVYEANTRPFEILRNQAKTVLLTFGPKFSVKSKHHIRSLDKVVPSAIMELLADILQDQENELVVGEPAKTFPLERVRLLVAEDNEINRKVLKRMLTKIGLKDVDFAENGEIAVAKEAGKQYDIIFMDHQMPVMGGVQACRTIMKRKEGHPVPKVVFVTAHVSPDFEAECASAGSSYFLPKPFKMDQIKKCLEDIAQNIEM